MLKMIPRKPEALLLSNPGFLLSKALTLRQLGVSWMYISPWRREEKEICHLAMLFFSLQENFNKIYTIPDKSIGQTRRSRRKSSNLDKEKP